MIDKYYAKSLLINLLALAFVGVFLYLMYLTLNWFIADFWNNTKFILKWIGIILLTLIAISLTMCFFELVNSEAKRMRRAAKENKDN